MKELIKNIIYFFKPKVTIFVTQDHIDKGIRVNGKACPIAHAMTESLNSEYHVGKCSWNNAKNYEEWGVLPQNAKDFIDAFDAGKEVKPFSFKIKVKSHRVPESYE